MTRPRLSVVIPTRGRVRTLGFTLQTCVAQQFDDCEFVVSDNSGASAVREVVEGLDDRRVRYARTAQLLAMSDSWEFAVSQASGEYVLLLGDDDALLLHALPEIDRILRLFRAPLLQWEMVCYTWPDVPANPFSTPNELLIPLTQVEGYQPIHLIESRPMMLAAAHSEISYAQLPMMYASAVHRRLLDRVRSRTGRVFRGRYPDVYSAFAFAYVAGYYHRCSAPMGLSGVSGASNGLAVLHLGDRSPVAEEFRRLNSEAGYAIDSYVPNVPLMAAQVAESFRSAKAAAFPDDAGLVLRRQAVVLACLRELQGRERPDRDTIEAEIRQSLRDDAGLLDWFEATRARTAGTPTPILRRYGGRYLHLDASDFGVTDVHGAALLCEKLLGYRSDGVNPHLAPWDRGEAASRASGAAAGPPTVASRTAGATDLHGQNLELSLLRRLGGRLTNHAAVDVGAERGMFVEAFLEAGCGRVYAIEPYPPNVRHLRRRFEADGRVSVLDLAVGPRDEARELHIAEDHSGREYGHYHSLVNFPDTPEIRRRKTLAVTCRSLDSLVEDGTIPAEVGILKIDTEGYDLEVLRGMGRLRAALVMVEFWDVPSAALGACPYSLREIADTLLDRGYSHALVVRRHEEFETLELDALGTRSGDWGNAIFLHDLVYPELADVIQEAISEVQTQLVDAASEVRRLAQYRLDVIDGLTAHRWLTPRLGHLRHHPPRPLVVPARYRAEPAVVGGPAISIVTATLNSERFVERTIRSVLDQEYAPCEYVIQDGGSSDATVRLLERYQERLTSIVTEKDEGQADALNRGFARTTGEIMAYLNGDDLLLPGTLRYVGRFFAAHPDVDVVYGHRVLINENDQEVGRWVLPRHTSAILSWADYVPQETLFWRRRIWERVGARFDDTLHFAMDWELLLRFRDAGARFVRLPRFLGAFRVHESQKTISRMGDLGTLEMQRLRERQHGRPVAPREVRRHVWGYLLRHIAYQKLYRLGVLDY